MDQSSERVKQDLQGASTPETFLRFQARVQSLSITSLLQLVAGVTKSLQLMRSHIGPESILPDRGQSIEEHCSCDLWNMFPWDPSSGIEVGFAREDRILRNSGCIATPKYGGSAIPKEVI